MILNPIKSHQDPLNLTIRDRISQSDSGVYGDSPKNRMMKLSWWKAQLVRRFSAAAQTDFLCLLGNIHLYTPMTTFYTYIYIWYYHIYTYMYIYVWYYKIYKHKHTHHSLCRIFREDMNKNSNDPKVPGAKALLIFLLAQLAWCSAGELWGAWGNIPKKHHRGTSGSCHLFLECTVPGFV